MTDTKQKQLGNTLWAIADQLRGAMDADDFRDYMLSFLFLRYLSDNYEAAARKELGSDYPTVGAESRLVPLAAWYAANAADVPAFEKQMRRKVHYVIQPLHLWSNVANMARQQDCELLHVLQAGFRYIETESFESTFAGLFSEIDLGSTKLGKTYADRNAKLCAIIQKIAEGLAAFSTDVDTLGDAYEYLIGQFAAGSGKKAGEFYTPQQISDVLSAIVTLDSQEPKTGVKQRLDSVMDFACGSGSLLMNVRRRMQKAGGTIGRIYGQEKNVTTYNLARMNMLLHGVKDTEFAARGAVQGRSGRAHPHQAAEGRAHRHRDRPAVQPVLFHGHSGLHPGAEEVQEAGRRAVHQRGGTLRQRQTPEPADRRAHRQDH